MVRNVAFYCCLSAFFACYYLLGAGWGIDYSVNLHVGADVGIFMFVKSKSKRGISYDVCLICLYLHAL